jgi:nucleoside phosphorylase
MDSTTAPALRLADVAVLTVIPDELEAARAALSIPDSARIKDADGTVYFHGQLYSELRLRPYEVVLGCIGAAGNPGAAAAAQAMLVRYRPKSLFLLGIAAGIRDKVRIGDVVLSDRVVAYEPAALVRGASGETKLQPRPEIDRTSHAMNQDVVSYRAVRERLHSLFERVGGRFPEPPEDKPDKKDEYRHHVASALHVQIGTIASGEKLFRDPAKLLNVREVIHGRTEVGEMEAAGVAEACRRMNTPWLVVRGISDFGDELKDDRFHHFAALAAAVVLVDFLAHGLALDAGAVTVRRDIERERRPFIYGRPIDSDQDLVGRDEERSLRRRGPVGAPPAISPRSVASDKDSDRILWLLPRGFLILDDLGPSTSATWSVKAHYYNYDGEQLSSTHYHESYEDSWRLANGLESQYRKLAIPRSDARYAEGALYLMMDIRTRQAGSSLEELVKPWAAEGEPVQIFLPGEVIYLPDPPSRFERLRETSDLRDLVAELHQISDKASPDKARLHKQLAGPRNRILLVVTKYLGAQHPSMITLQGVVDSYDARWNADALLRWKTEVTVAVTEIFQYIIAS